jgi:hypothetical protein
MSTNVHDAMLAAYNRHVSEYMHTTINPVKLRTQQELQSSRIEIPIAQASFLAFVGNNHEYIAVITNVNSVKTLFIYNSNPITLFRTRPHCIFFVIPTCFNQTNSDYIMENFSDGFRAYNWKHDREHRMIPFKTVEMLVFNNYTIAINSTRTQISVFNFLTGERLKSISTTSPWRPNFHLKFCTESRFFIESYNSADWQTGVTVFDLDRGCIDKVIELPGREGGLKYDLVYNGLILLQYRESLGWDEEENLIHLKLLNLETEQIDEVINVTNNRTRLASTILSENTVAVADSSFIFVIDTKKKQIVHTFDISIPNIRRLVYSNKTGIIACVCETSIILYSITSDIAILNYFAQLSSCRAFQDITISSMPYE